MTFPVTPPPLRWVRDGGTASADSHPAAAGRPRSAEARPGARVVERRGLLKDWVGRRAEPQATNGGPHSTRDGRGYDEDMARGGERPATRFHRRQHAVARETGRGLSSRSGAAVRDVRPAAGPADPGPAARWAPGTRLSPLPPGGVAAAARGAPGSGAERAAPNRGRSGRPDRSAGERPAARGEVPTAVPVAPAGAGGGAPGAGVGLTALPPILCTEVLDLTVSRGMCDMTSLDIPASDDRRSEARQRAPRRVQRLCRRCGRRNAVSARYTWKRRVNRHRHHDLCSQCRRAVRDSARATPPPRH